MGLRRRLTPLVACCLLFTARHAAAAVPMFVQITDTHLGKAASYEGDKAVWLANARRVIQEAKALGAEFIVLTGDCTTMSDDASLELVAQVIKESPLPIYAVPGNHDDAAMLRGAYQKLVGPTRQVIYRPPWYVVAYSDRPLASPKGEHPEELLGWLDQQLQAAPAGATRIVAAHHPLHWDANWADLRFNRADFQLTGPWAIRLNLLMAERGVAAYLSGHTHGTMEVEDEQSGIPCLITGSTDQGNYRICCLDRGVFSTVATRAGDWPKVVILGPRGRYPGGSSFVVGTVPVRARVFAPGAVERVELSLDGGAPIPLSPAEDGVWQVTWDTKAVKNGKHELKLTATAHGQSRTTTSLVAVSNLEQTTF